MLNFTPIGKAPAEKSVTYTELIQKAVINPTPSSTRVWYRLKARIYVFLFVNNISLCRISQVCELSQRTGHITAVERGRLYLTPSFRVNP